MHAQVVDYAVNVNDVFPFDLENQTIDGYEGPRASDTSTEGTGTQTFNISTKFTGTFAVSACVCVCSRPAVYHGGRVSGVLVHVLSDQMSEADQELGGFWYPVIWPGREVELTHRAGLCCFHLNNIHRSALGDRGIY